VRLPLAAVLSALLALGSIAGWPEAARADACEWTGDVSNAWENSANWTCGRIPTPTDHVTIGGEVEVDSSVTVAALTLKSWANLSSPRPTPVISVSGDMLWTGGSVGMGVDVLGITKIEGEEDKAIIGRGRLTTSTASGGLDISGPGALLIDSDPGFTGVTSPRALLRGGARVEGSGCCSALRSWDVEEILVADDAYIIDLETRLGSASVAAGAQLNIAGGLLRVAGSTPAIQRTFGAVPGFQGGTMVVGAPKPDREGGEGTDVLLPALVELESITWEQRSGALRSSGKATMKATSAQASSFLWTGGSVITDLTLALPARFSGQQDQTLSLSSEGGTAIGQLTVTRSSSIVAGAYLEATSGTSITVTAPARFVQYPGTSIVGTSLPAPSIKGSGTWATTTGTGSPATLRDIFLSTSFVDVDRGTLSIEGALPQRIDQLLVRVEANGSGQLLVPDGALRLGSIKPVRLKSYLPAPGKSFSVASAASVIQVPTVAWNSSRVTRTTLLTSRVQGGLISLVVTRETDVTISSRCYACPSRDDFGGDFVGQFVITRPGGSGFAPGTSVKVQFGGENASFRPYKPSRSSPLPRCTRDGATLTCEVPDNVRSYTIYLAITTVRTYRPSVVNGYLGAAEPLSDPDKAVASVMYTVRN
jgi:hypothetical protein